MQLVIDGSNDRLDIGSYRHDSPDLSASPSAETLVAGSLIGTASRSNSLSAALVFAEPATRGTADAQTRANTRRQLRHADNIRQEGSTR
jgi:hypothetical protein